MTTIKFELEADVRTDLGKGASRRLRYTNKVPAIVYGAGEPASSLTLDHNKVIHALSHEAVYSHILTLKVGTKNEKVILKDVQRNPAKPRILHLDFLRVKPDQKLHMRVPIHFLGEDDAPGVKSGGIITHTMAEIEIACLPANLPEYIEVDLSKLGIDETIHLADVKVPPGVEFAAFAHGVEGHNLPVVSIHMPRILKDETTSVTATGIATEASAESDTAATADKATEAGKKNKE